MPDRRSNRGAHPKDRSCFDPRELVRLRSAVDDLSWLRTRGYSSKAASQLVGNRYALKDRQRRALARCAAGDHEVVERQRRQLPAEALKGEIVVVDGYNVLLTLEAALSGGVLLRGRDGALRDLAAMSAHYRRVQATGPAIDLTAQFLAEYGSQKVLWLLDRPVSNSGRLKRLIDARVEGRKPPWSVELEDRTDARLAEADAVVASADSGVLDRCRRWVNLASLIVKRHIPQAWVVDLS